MEWLILGVAVCVLAALQAVGVDLAPLFDLLDHLVDLADEVVPPAAEARPSEL